MEPSDDYEQTIANKLQEIHQLEIEALRRAGVAQEKEQGLEIESTEAIRLYREATGYILRLRELREDITDEMAYADIYHPERIIGHIEDYNRILRSIRDNPSFENTVKEYAELDYSKGPHHFQIDFPHGEVKIRTKSTNSMMGAPDKLEMDGSNVKTAVLPRLRRLTKDMENSLIGRCASGKRA